MEDILCQSYLFEGIHESLYPKILAGAGQANLETGSLLFREGEQAKALYVLLEGQIQILKKVEDEQTVVAELGAGAVIGEIPILGLERHRSASAVSTGAGKILQIPYESLDHCIVNDPILGVQIYRNLARMLASRLSKTTKNLSLMVFQQTEHSGQK